MTVSIYNEVQSEINLCLSLQPYILADLQHNMNFRNRQIMVNLVKWSVYRGDRGEDGEETYISSYHGLCL